MHIYSLYIYIYIKTLKTLLHVTIIRSSSGIKLCSLLKSQFKTFSDLLRYINLVLWQHVVCYVWVGSLCNFSKEQSMLPDDDRMIETCRGVLSVLM